jgi:hypothetical protein
LESPIEAEREAGKVLNLALLALTATLVAKLPEAGLTQTAFFV